MRERVEAIVGRQAASEVMLGTFHSVCLKLLRRMGDALSRVEPGLDAQFSVYDTDDCRQVTAETLMHELGAAGRASKRHGRARPDTDETVTKLLWLISETDETLHHNFNTTLVGFCYCNMKLVADILLEGQFEKSPSVMREVLGGISRYKSQGLTPQDVAAMEAEEPQEENKKNKSAFEERSERLFYVYPRYQEALVRRNAADFDDLILLTLRVIAEDRDARSMVARRFRHILVDEWQMFISKLELTLSSRARWARCLRHILVDEWQDTNGPQYDLVKLLAEASCANSYSNSNSAGVMTTRVPSIFVVGDADQSIYAFRGAVAGNVKKTSSVRLSFSQTTTAAAGASPPLRAPFLLFKLIFKVRLKLTFTFSMVAVLNTRCNRCAWHQVDRFEEDFKCETVVLAQNYRCSGRTLATDVSGVVSHFQHCCKRCSLLHLPPNFLHVTPSVQVDRFEEDFKCETVVLAQNYRCSGRIAAAASAVIAKVPNRQPKALVAVKDKGLPLGVMTCYNAAQEAAEIAKQVSRYWTRGTVPLSEMAVMYRTNAQSRALEEAFLRQGVPYRVVDGQKFFARREVRDCLAYLRVLAAPADATALSRAAFTPARGIGAKTMESLLQWAAAERVTPVECVLAALDPFELEPLRTILEKGAGERSEESKADADNGSEGDFKQKENPVFGSDGSTRRRQRQQQRGNGWSGVRLRRVTALRITACCNHSYDTTSAECDSPVALNTCCAENPLSDAAAAAAAAARDGWSGVSLRRVAALRASALTTPRLKPLTRKLADFASLLVSLKQRSAQGTVAAVLEHLVAITDMEEYVKRARSGDPDPKAGGLDKGEERWGNVVELVRSAERTSAAGAAGLAAFLAEVALMGGDEAPRSGGSGGPDSDSDSPAAVSEVVRLMTIHASKGLEFDTVFIVGCEEGTLPLERGGGYKNRGGGAGAASSVEEAEERRLMYVAITRAKSRLFMSWRRTLTILSGAGADGDAGGGGMRCIDAYPSRYLEDLPKSGVVKHLDMGGGDFQDALKAKKASAKAAANGGGGGRGAWQQGARSGGGGKAWGANGSASKGSGAAESRGIKVSHRIHGEGTLVGWQSAPPQQPPASEGATTKTPVRGAALRSVPAAAAAAAAAAAGASQGGAAAVPREAAAVASSQQQRCRGLCQRASLARGRVCISTARHGRLELLLQWAHLNACRCCDESVCCDAPSRGHLRVLQRSAQALCRDTVPRRSVWIAQSAAALDPTVTPEEALAAATRATPAVTATVTPVEQPPAMPQVGAAAPNFNLPFSSRASDGTVSLEQLAGKWVVLYFYPADGTSVCSIEAARFQKNLEAFREREVQILGVSLDDVASHRSFCSDLKLDFPLLADANGETSYKYGALVTDPQYGAYALRTTFLIDPEGVVRHVWPRVTAAARHADEVLAKVDALRTRKS
ncbi:P-loop containing nucleoside triphosphate hydrolase protein [Tribonema minus]|uniref:DNA 3'-5' helicase n=1 Tax=Tribonema minus TaxID=303371 RepID=A0A835Z3L0_9STRA|nr:P-loop containing nucleoside triphosphate hydrolase protein [Tribonema minus]